MANLGNDHEFTSKEYIFIGTRHFGKIQSKVTRAHVQSGQYHTITISTHPSDQILLFNWTSVVNDSLAGDELQQDDAKAVDVGFERELSGFLILRSTISIGSHNSGGNMGIVPDRPELCQTKIRQLCIEIIV